MNPSTITHRPLSEYAFALDDTHYVFRLRTGREEAKECLFYYADRAAMTSDLTFISLPMNRVRRDRHFDWYEIRLKTHWERIAYYFVLTDGIEKLYYYGDCYDVVPITNEEEKEFVPYRADPFQLPFNHRADRLMVPEWTKDAIVYNIFPDSFASHGGELSKTAAKHCYEGHNTVSLLGGTLRGIEENLSYIAGLGCNCIYLNPIFAAGAYHKYDTLDYFHIDPCMGTDDDLRRLVKTAHSMGIRILLDGVFNHISWEHPMFQDVLKKGHASEYASCFYQLPQKPTLPKKGELPEYTCFSYVANMPKTNTASPYLREYFCQVGAYWIREYDIDGWRLDVANELDGGFLRAFRQAVKAEKPEAIVVGEVWENASHHLQGDQIDSAMNYDFRRYCRRFFAEKTVDARTFDTNMTTLLYRYKEPALFAQLNLLDSHDVSRFFTLCGEDVGPMELAILFQMTFPGMPCIFYGDEKGLSGIEEWEYRQAMAWKKEHPLEKIYQRFIALRQSQPALRYGDFQTVWAQDRTYGYVRSWKGQQLLILLNAGGSPWKNPTIEELLSKDAWDQETIVEETAVLLLKKGCEEGIIEPWGYEVWRISRQ